MVDIGLVGNEGKGDHSLALVMVCCFQKKSFSISEEIIFPFLFVKGLEKLHLV
jgi:hypothetical protein